MNIFFTFDYEIYFGENHGTVEKCIIHPTNELIRIAEIHNVRFTFFVDIGFVIKLSQQKEKHPHLQKDYNAITQQIKFLSDTGHAVELHIHPHWEDSYYDGNRWVINVDRYKLIDFSRNEIDRIVGEYKSGLESITGKKTQTYRAGGWCLQPFSQVKDVFKKYEIKLDSTVYKNGCYSTEQYSYDFRNAPDKDIYRFDDDLCVENKEGYFTELPITSIKNSPLFFWRLFLLGRKNPHLHKPLGDGKAMPAPGYRKKLLTKYTVNPVSVDGYNAILLQKVLSRLIKQNKRHMVVIGHPKALSRFSLIKIEEFVKENSKEHQIASTKILL